MDGRNLNHLLMQAPVALCIVSGPEYKVELANERMLEFLGRTPDIIGQPIEQTLTEAKKQGLIAILDKVRVSGQSYSIPNLPAVILINGERVTRYFSLIFKPYSLGVAMEERSGIFCVAHNITDQVLALQHLEEEKKRTQLALEVGELGMLSTDWKNNTATADKRAHEIFGFEGDHPLEDFINRIHPDDRIIRSEAIQNGIQTGSFDFEVRLQFEDGRKRWMRSRGMVQKDIEGNATGSFGVVQDITVQKEFAIALNQKVEERTRQLEEQKNLLDNILKNSSNGISVSQVFRNEEGKVIDAQTIMANDAAVNYIGFPKEIYLSKRATEIEPAVMSSPYYLACINTLEIGEPFMMQYYMESTKRWLELTVSKLDYNHLIQVFTDISTIKKTQLDLEKTVENLRQSNLKLEEFTRSASHDLKEPIRKVQYFTSKLKSILENKTNEEENSLFNRVESAIERMQLLVDNLLEYSSLNHRPAEKTKTDLNDILRVILSDLELVITEKKAEFHIEKLPEINGYRWQLGQLFYNLISNALTYSQADRIPHIDIRYDIGKPEVVPAGWDGFSQFHIIEVCDNGIGFEAEDAERIFNVFTRLHGNRDYPGTGIGLSIVKKAVENHDGIIYAKGEVGKGACFVVMLPYETE